MNEKLFLHKKYYKELLEINTINILIIGKDPYPTSPNGIPFCKDDINDLKKSNCSGKYLLFGLGIDLDKETRNPEDIFFNLLRKDKIGFINSSYFFLGKRKITSNEIEYSESINKPILKKSQIIVATKSSLKILKEYNKLPDNIIEISHPDNRNKNSRYEKVRNSWSAIYSKLNGLVDFIETQKK